MAAYHKMFRAARPRLHPGAATLRLPLGRQRGKPGDSPAADACRKKGDPHRGVTENRGRAVIAEPVVMGRRAGGQSSRRRAISRGCWRKICDHYDVPADRR